MLSAINRCSVNRLQIQFQFIGIETGRRFFQPIWRQTESCNRGRHWWSLFCINWLRPARCPNRRGFARPTNIHSRGDFDPCRCGRDSHFPCFKALLMHKNHTRHRLWRKETWLTLQLSCGHPVLRTDHICQCETRPQIAQRCRIRAYCTLQEGIPTNSSMTLSIAGL